MRKILVDGWDFSLMLTTREVADIFRVKRFSVMRWAKDGSLVSLKTPTGEYRFSKQQIDHLVRGGQPRDEPPSPFSVS